MAGKSNLSAVDGIYYSESARKQRIKKLSNIYMLNVLMFSILISLFHTYTCLHAPPGYSVRSVYDVSRTGRVFVPVFDIVSLQARFISNYVSQVKKKKKQ